MRKLSSGKSSSKVDTNSHDITSKRRPGKMMTGPGSHFSRVRSSRQTMRHIESRMSNARERRPQTVEQRAQETTTANGPRGSEDMYYEAMTVGTTQVNGGTSYEATQATTEAAPTRWKSNPQPASRPVSGTQQKQMPPVPLRSSRDRSLGATEGEAAAVAAAASAYCTKEKIPKRASWDTEPPSHAPKRPVSAPRHIPVQTQQYAGERRQIPVQTEAVYSERQRIPVQQEPSAAQQQYSHMQPEQYAAERRQIPVQSEPLPVDRGYIFVEAEPIAQEPRQIPVQSQAFAAEPQYIPVQSEVFVTQRRKIPIQTELSPELPPTEPEHAPVQRIIVEEEVSVVGPEEEEGETPSAEYEQAPWNDDEIIESGDGLRSAIPINIETDDDDASRGWDVPETASAPANMTTAKKENPGGEEVMQRYPSPRRQATVVIGHATNIPFRAVEEQPERPAEREREARPAQIAPVYSVAVRQAEAEKAVEDEHRPHGEELAAKEHEVPREERPKVILACKTAEWQAEAEAVVEPRHHKMPGTKASVDKGMGEEEKRQEHPSERTGAGQPFLEEEDRGAGMVAGIERSPVRSEEIDIYNQFPATRQPPMVSPPEPVDAWELQEQEPTSTQQEAREEPEMPHRHRIPITEESEGPPPVSQQTREQMAPSKVSPVAKEEPYFEQPRAPAHTPTAATAAPVAAVPVAAVPVAAVPVAAAEPLAAEPVTGAEPVAAQPSETVTTARETAAEPSQPETTRKPSRAERRRAEKEAKALDKRRQKEEKERLKEQQRLHQESVKRNEQQLKQQQQQQQQQQQAERRDSKIENEGFFSRIMRRMSSKPTDATNAGGGSGEAAAGPATAGQHGTTTTTTATTTTTTNQPAMLAT